MQLIIIVKCFYNVFVLVFINGVQFFVAPQSTPRCNVSCFTTSPTRSLSSLATFLLSFTSFLATAVLPRVLPDLHLCHLRHLGIRFHSNSDPFQNLSVLCLFLDGQLPA